MTDDLRDIDSAATEDTSESDDSPTGEPLGDEAEIGSPAERPRRGLLRVLRRIVPVVLVLLLLVSGGVATWLYFKQYRPDQQTDAGVSRAVAGAASDGTTALLSYSSDSLDQDFAAARSHLTGDFLSYYDQFTQQSVAPVAKQKSMKTTARVTGAAVVEPLRPDSAVVLVFVDQTTTTKDSPQPSVAVTSALVHLTRVNGNWLITKFTPV